ncbi:MAG: glycoside hydrolase, partial [Lacipirellulaceae bacterium]
MKYSFKTFAIVVLLSFAIPEAIASEEDLITPPEGGNQIVAFDQDLPLQFQSQNVEATGRWAAAKDMPFKEVYRIESDTRFSDPKNMQLSIPLAASIRKGDVLLLSFWVHRPRAGGQPNNIYLSIGDKDAPAIYENQLSAYRVWKQHVRSFIAPRDCDSTDAAIHFDLGEAGKIAEIAAIQLINYGPDRDPATLPRSTVNYPGRSPDAQWRKEALKRIEEIRKGEIAVKVVDALGEPVIDANVEIAMQQHAFGFGNAVNSEMLGAEKKDFPIRPKGKATVKWEDAQKYREVVKKYFDRVTFESELRPANWQAMKKGNPAWQRKHRILMTQTLPWLQENNIDARGHYIAWAPMDFNAIEKQFLGKPKEHRAWLWDHMADVLP